MVRDVWGVGQQKVCCYTPVTFLMVVTTVESNYIEEQMDGLSQSTTKPAHV